jgi:hypothetical protein
MTDETPNWKPYEGKEVYIIFNGGNVTGKMQSPRIDRDYVDFNPHIVYNPDGSCYLEKETPRRIAINRIFGGDPDYLAFNEGQLVKIVEETNKKVKTRNNHILGFNQSEQTKPQQTL